MSLLKVIEFFIVLILKRELAVNLVGYYCRITKAKKTQATNDFVARIRL